MVKLISVESTHVCITFYMQLLTMVASKGLLYINISMINFQKYGFVELPLLWKNLTKNMVFLLKDNLRTSILII